MAGLTSENCVRAKPARFLFSPCVLNQLCEFSSEKMPKHKKRPSKPTGKVAKRPANRPRTTRYDAGTKENAFVLREGSASNGPESRTRTVDKPFSGNIRAGKNTYVYDAHTYHTKVPP